MKKRRKEKRTYFDSDLTDFILTLSVWDLIGRFGVKVEEPNLSP